MKWMFLSFALLFTGCSTFNKEWSAATKQAAHTGVNGPWEGEWRSEKNGHHGSLRCVLTQTSPTEFRAHYRAKYMKILRFTYVATLTGRETNGAVALQGSSNLGKLAGGVYSYDAVVTPESFKSSYNSKYDHGNYTMSRPPSVEE